MANPLGLCDECGGKLATQIDQERSKHAWAGAASLCWDDFDGPHAAQAWPTDRVPSWAHSAACLIMNDLRDRGGIGDEMDRCDADVLSEIESKIAEQIAVCVPPSDADERSRTLEEARVAAAAEQLDWSHSDAAWAACANICKRIRALANPAKQTALGEKEGGK